MTATNAALGRRDFTRLLTVGVGGVCLGLGSQSQPVDAQEAAAPMSPDRPPLEVLLLAAVVGECPGDHWDEATLEDVLNDIRGDLARARLLKTVPLANGDDPATIFVAPALPHALKEPS